MKISTKARLGVALLASAALVAGCSGGSTTSAPASPAESASETTTEGTAGDVSIGVIQLVSHPALDQANAGFQAALADAGYNVTYDQQNAQADQSIAASIAGKFASDDLDLVLAIATPAAQAIAQAVTDKPVLFTAVTDPEHAGLVESNEAPGGNVTGTSDANPVLEQMALFEQLRPGIQTIGIVYAPGEDNSGVQVEWAKTAAEELGLTLELATVVTSGDVQQAAESLGDVDGIYVPTDNIVVSALESVLAVAEAKKIPVVVGEGDSVARGGVITYGINYFDLGYQTGQMAVRILEGADPATTPVETQDVLEVYINLTAAERMDVVVPQELIDQAKPENITE